MMKKLRIQKKLLVPSVLFITTAGNLNLHQEVRGSAISFLREAYPRKFPFIKTIPTTETEIKNVIQSLKTKNSSGYDGITSKIFKSLCIPNQSPINLHLQSLTIHGNLP
jgi:hypothetical protein